MTVEQIRFFLALITIFNVVNSQFLSLDDLEDTTLKYQQTRAVATSRPGKYLYPPSATISGAGLSVSGCASPNIRNGLVRILGGGTKAAPSTVAVDEQIILSCLSGFGLVGLRIASCNAGGAWSNSLGQCVQINNPTTTVAATSPYSELMCVVPKITNGRVTSNGIIFRHEDEINVVPHGTMIAIVCDSGYRLVTGTRTSVCTLTGQWSTNLGRCVERNDGVPATEPPTTTTSAVITTVTTTRTTPVPAPSPVFIVTSTLPSTAIKTETIPLIDTVPVTQSTQFDKYRQTRPPVLTTSTTTESFLETFTNFTSTEPPSTTPRYERETCGLKSGVAYKIFGGTSASYPWMARFEIIYFDDLTVPQMFAGTLIAPGWILTTANRLIGRRIARASIYLGTNYRKNPFYISGAGNQVEARYKTVIPHPNYDQADPFHYNFALVQLNTTFPLGRDIQPICLPDFPDQMCDSLEYPKTRRLVDSCDEIIAAGWGLTELSRLFPNELRHVPLKIWSYNDCKLKANDLSEYEYCAGGEPGKDTCTGDSGGPAMCLKRGRYYLTGVTSSSPSPACGVAEIPSIYGRVCSVLDWIHATIGDTSEKR